MKRVRAMVSGRVQGVCFRAYTRDRARRLGVTGHVRNLPDGRVEIVAQGEDSDVDSLLEWASRGPSHASVSNVSVEELEPGWEQMDFRIEY
ncbi:MAG: acylphosphatase [Candidatus Aegiribacteria sp.]